jgi:hypothetical protein
VVRQPVRQYLLGSVTYEQNYLRALRLVSQTRASICRYLTLYKSATRALVPRPRRA